jgi:hypothetical protein
MRDKVGPRDAAFDAKAIARAEAALRDLSENFDAWMSQDADRLDGARLAARASRFAEAETEQLFCRAHDVKGLAATYDYPLATTIAASLCRLIESPGVRALARHAPSLIEAHVDAIRAVVRDRVKDPNDATGKALAQALRGHVDALIGAE